MCARAGRDTRRAFINRCAWSAQDRTAAAIARGDRGAAHAAFVTEAPFWDPDFDQYPEAYRREFSSAVRQVVESVPGATVSAQARRRLQHDARHRAPESQGRRDFHGVRSYPCPLTACFAPSGRSCSACGCCGRWCVTTPRAKYCSLSRATRFTRRWNVAYLPLLAGFTLLSFFAGNAVRGARRLGLMLGRRGRMRRGPRVRQDAHDAASRGRQLLRAAGHRVHRGLLSRERRETGGNSRLLAVHELLPAPHGGAHRPRRRVSAAARQDERSSDTAALWEALVLICFGLFKKLVIADNLAAVADPIFADLHASPSRILLATYAFTVQIYCDFSGYTDIALGVARLFGYKLPENFNWPYLSKNPADFWRRWHISLSNWLRDYIYFLAARAAFEAEDFFVREFPDHDADLRRVARRRVDVRAVGSVSRRAARGILCDSRCAPEADRSRRALRRNKLGALLSILRDAAARGDRMDSLPAESSFRSAGVPAFARDTVRSMRDSTPRNGWRSRSSGSRLWRIIVEIRVPITKTALTNRWNPWVMWVLSDRGARVDGAEPAEAADVLVFPLLIRCCRSQR